MTPLEETLALWKKLSETPDQEIRNPRYWKNLILIELGIGTRWYGCPLCAAYMSKAFCPIGDCTVRADGHKTFKPCERDTPYKEYLAVANKGIHSQLHAASFYRYLQGLKEPDPSTHEEVD